MKVDFKEYYAPMKAEYKQLWTDEVIVPDTNVLLSLYRIPVTARDELLALLELLRNRLWIPHQVALEFQRRRLSVIYTERKVIEDALSKASELFESIQEWVISL